MSYIPCFDFFQFSHLFNSDGGLATFSFIFIMLFLQLFQLVNVRKDGCALKVVFDLVKCVCVFFCFVCLYNSIYLLVLGRARLLSEVRPNNSDISFTRSLSFQVKIFLLFRLLFGAVEGDEQEWGFKDCLFEWMFRLTCSLKSVFFLNLIIFVTTNLQLFLKIPLEEIFE